MARSVSETFDQLEVELSRAANERSGAWLRSNLEHGSFIYGAGGFGRRLAALLREQGFPCYGMIDRRAGSAASNCGDLALLHPDSLTPDLCRGRNFILGIFNPYDDMGEIVRFARSLGFAEIFWAADLPDALGPTLNDMWLGGRQVLVDNFEKIRALSGLLADQASIDTLASVIRFRALDGDQSDPAPSSGDQYLPADLPNFPAPICLVDGGAYDGDTYRSLRTLGVAIDTWIAFEPDPQNFKQLVQKGAEPGTRAIFVPCGLSDRAHQVQFAAGHQAGSRIVHDQRSLSMDARSTTIQCLSIDESFPGTMVDYIKLDIEGAESTALKGMTRTIERCRPRLAVSSYHRAQDLWEVPLQLASILPDAALYLRQHYPNTYDVVAYAIPRPR